MNGFAHTFLFLGVGNQGLRVVGENIFNLMGPEHHREWLRAYPFVLGGSGFRV